MKKIFLATCLLALTNIGVHAQSFKKGSLVISISEGATNGRFTTKDVNSGHIVRDGNVGGDRDPLTIEYGITNKWGVGVNMGADIHHISPAFYNLKVSTAKIDAITSELTVDANYHFFVTERTDLSAFGSIGVSSVFFKGTNGDKAYEYNAGGSIIRFGAKAKYYAFRRFGFLGMMSAYSSSCSPNQKKTSTESQAISTKIIGTALEFGLCYRVKK
jgi:hypothetical protein